MALAFRFAWLCCGALLALDGCGGRSSLGAASQSEDAGAEPSDDNDDDDEGTCGRGFLRCEGRCIDPATDQVFCGASADCSGSRAGESCGLVRACVAGSCVQDDARLAELSVAPGTLQPSFSSDRTSYRVETPIGTSSVSVTATPVDADATLTINGSPAFAGEPRSVPLQVGTTALSVIAKAPSGTTLKYELLLFSEALSQGYLKAHNASAGDMFGATLALDGDTLAVAALTQDQAASNGPASAPRDLTDSGGVYVFVRRDSLWTEQAFLKASNASAGDLFGTSLALDGDTLVVGAPLEDASGADSGNDSASNAGAVYVFERSGVAWTERAYLKASNAGAGDLFGSSVALSGDTLAVAAVGEGSRAENGIADPADDSLPYAGAVYIFARRGSTWTEQAYLKAPYNQEASEFGRSVALSGDTLAVGAPRDDGLGLGETTGVYTGAVHVFRQSGTTWSQEAYFRASNTEAGDILGRAVALDGDTLVASARGEDSAATAVNGDGNDNSASLSGAVYVFRRSGTTWTEEAYLKAFNTDPIDHFGWSIALSRDAVLVGAIWEGSGSTEIDVGQEDDSAPKAGAAYLFTRSGSSFSPKAYLKAFNGEAGDQYGWSVALDGETAAIGASAESSSTNSVGRNPGNNLAPGAGAVYVVSPLSGL